MASKTGSNPESSEPVFDLETQLDDLLEQIDKAQPGLDDTAAPISSQPQDQPQDDMQGELQDQPQGELDEDQLELQGDFETVETVESADPADPAAAREVKASNIQTQDHQNEPETNKPIVTAEQPAQADLSDHTGPPAQSDQDDADMQEADDDDLAFSPEDFVTTEQAANIQPSQRAAHTAPTEPAEPTDAQAIDELEQILATPNHEQVVAAPDQPRPIHDIADQATTDDASIDQATPDDATSDSLTSDDDPDDLLGLDLASQIQQLLDDARTDDNQGNASDKPAKQPAKQPTVQPVTPQAVASSEPTADVVADVDAADDVDVDAEVSSQDFDASMFETTQETLPDSQDLQATLDAVAQTLETDENQTAAASADESVDEAIDQTVEESVDQSVAEPVAEAVDETVDETVDELADESELNQPVAAEGAVSSEPEPYAPDQDAAAMSLDDIDQMLADEADEALAGDFETTSDVLAEASSSPEAEAPKTEVAQADADAGAQAMDGDADDELDFAGSFETTQEIITQEAEGSQGSQGSQVQGLSAGAQAVARELDEQPENQQAGSADASSASDSGTLTMPGNRRGLNLSGLAAFTRVPDVARQVCTTISRPMEAVAPQTRDLVGYIGLITLFWGTVTLIVKFIFAVSH